MESTVLGVILDTSLLIASERSGKDATALMRYFRSVFGEVPAALSAVSVVELTHGIYRAKLPSHRERRERFAGELFRLITVHPLTLELALLAGRIHGQQMDRGVAIDFADLLIGCTALHLGYKLATLNQKHFAQIPGLTLVTPDRP